MVLNLYDAILIRWCQWEDISCDPRRKESIADQVGLGHRFRSVFHLTHFAEIPPLRAMWHVTTQFSSIYRTSDVNYNGVKRWSRSKVLVGLVLSLTYHSKYDVMKVATRIPCKYFDVQSRGPTKICKQYMYGTPNRNIREHSALISSICGQARKEHQAQNLG